MDLTASEETISLLLGNYLDWEQALLALAQRYVVFPNYDHSQAMVDRLELDRRVSNLLSACRFYLDRSEATISAFYGKRSAELKKFKHARSVCYDRAAAYRFLEALRNYVQHCGFAIGAIAFKSHGLENGGDAMGEFRIGATVDLRSLRESGDFKSAVLSEYSAEVRDVDLVPLFRVYVHEILGLHELLREILTPKRNDAQKLYSDALREFSHSAFGELKTPRLLVINDAGAVTSEIHLVDYPIEHYRFLSGRPICTRRFDRAFVSNRC